MADKTPENGQRCTVKTAKGDELAVWTGFMWATADGSRIIEGADIKSWEPAPFEDELTIRKQDEDE